MLDDRVVAHPVDESASSVPLLARQGVLSALALFFLSTVWVPAAVTAVLLLTHLQSWQLPAGALSVVILGLAGIFLFRGLSRRGALQIAVLVLLSILGAAAVSIRFYDSSVDGRGYHTDAILGLLRGINPIYAQFPAVEPVWSNHYPKGAWYFAAVVIHLFHNYQLGKIYTFLLIFAAAAYAVKFFRQEGFSPRTSALLGFIAAFSPVALAQMLTYCVDGALGSLIVLMILSGVNAVFRPSHLDRVVFALAGSLAIGLKFTGGPYVVAVVFVMVATRLWYRWRGSDTPVAPHLRADAACLAALTLFGVLVLGYNPYITNMLQGQNPMYPLLGPNKVDIITGGLPIGWAEGHYSTPRKLLISFFSRTQAHTEHPSAFKVPFTVYKQEIVSLAAPDARLAAWGVFFSGVTLVSLILFLRAKGWRNAPIALAILLVVVTTFMNPECWMARYAPQFAMLPILFLVPALNFPSGWVRLAARVMVVFLLLNGLISAGAAAAAALIKTRKLDSSLAYVATIGGPGEYWAYLEPEHLDHFDQFSGKKGIVICGQISPPRYPMPSGGFPLNINMDDEPEVVLYKGNCAAGPPL